MFDQQYQSPKQEPFIKQEFDIDDISQYQYPPADWFPQTINTGLEPGSFPSTMSHQFSSRSYSSNSTQDSNSYSSISTRDSIGYFDQTTEQWTDFDSKDEYVNSPTRDNSFPSPMPLYYGEPTYLDNDSLQTPRRTDAKALSAIQGSTRTDNATMQVSSSYQQSPLFDQSSSIHLQSSVPMTRQTSKYVHSTLDRGVPSNFRQHSWQGRSMAMFEVPKSLHPLCGSESALHNSPQPRCR